MRAVRAGVMATRMGVLVAVVSGFMAGCSGEDAPPATSEAVQDVAGQASAPAPDGVSGDRAKEIYNNFCFSCHAAGLSGAPKLGDVEAWAPRIAKGRDLLIQSTIVGVPPAMPARGICFDCSDAELAATVDYMIEKSR